MDDLTALLVEGENGDILVLVGDDQSATDVSASDVIATMENLIANANWANETEQMHASIMLAVFRQAVLSTL